MKKFTQRFRQKISIGLSFLLAAGMLAACGNNSNSSKTTEEAMQSAGPVYNMQQQVFCLNMLSNVSARYNSYQGIQDSTAAAIKAVLADDSVIKYIGNWQCIWGPYVLTNKAGDTAVNTMYIAQQTGTANFVVAIAGTDPSSKFDWEFEDGDIAILPWSLFIKNSGYISGATMTGLLALKIMGNPDSLAHQVLVTRANSMNNMQIWVAGHSLGGALAPAFALYLADNMPSSTWAPKSNVVINCQAVAGATPGDSTFSAYYNSKLGKTTTRVWNTRDVVPHGYAQYMLKELPTLYPADSVSPMPGWMQVAVKAVELATKLQHFTQLYPATIDSFTSCIYTQDSIHSATPFNDTAYTSQALFQHIPAYGVYFGTLAFQQAAQRVLNLPAPMFTQSAILVPVY